MPYLLTIFNDYTILTYGICTRCSFAHTNAFLELSGVICTYLELSGATWSYLELSQAWRQPHCLKLCFLLAGSIPYARLHAQMLILSLLELSGNYLKLSALLISHTNNFTILALISCILYPGEEIEGGTSILTTKLV